MSDVHRIYTQKVWQQLAFRPVWEPGTSLAVSAVGTFKDGVFHREACLDDFDILQDRDYQVMTESAARDTSAAARGSFQTMVNTGAQLPPQFSYLANVKAKIGVNFKDEGAFLLTSRGCQWTRIRNQIKRGREAIHMAANLRHLRENHPAVYLRLNK
jgi:hypothetical protein